jgi:hypothetical protein
MPRQQVADGRHAAVEAGHLRIDLDPVARTHHERPGHIAGPEHVTEQLAQRVAAERGPLQDRHGRARVRQPHHQHAHLTFPLTYFPPAFGTPLRQCLPSPLGRGFLAVYLADDSARAGRKQGG